jgi:hypothetical protein
MRHRLGSLALAFALLALASPLAAATLTCPSAATLEDLAVCIRTQMPGSGSNGFVAPNAAEQADWRTVVRQMLQGQCGFALPASLSTAMQIRTFTDSGNGKSYCLLMEVLDANNNGKVDRGWGTFLVDNAAVRELSHQAPHPISDSTTEVQAIGLFKGTESRSYLMSGAHRDANGGSSSCQSSYGPADAAHNVANMFHATNAELMAWYGANEWYAIQWHGMAADTCGTVEVYLSHGRNVAPLSADKISELRTNVLTDHPTWKVFTPGTGACSLNATDNTQGRLINGVDPNSVCGTAAISYTGRFLHIEQDPGFRTPADWLHAVGVTFPAGGGPAPADFATSISPTLRTVNASGGTATYTVAIARTNFTDPVALSISGLPSGATASFNPNPAGSTSSTLTVVVPPSSPKGTFTLTVTATGGGLTRTATTQLRKK